MTTPRSRAGSTQTHSIVTAPPQGSPSSSPRQRWRLYLRLPAARLPGELPAGAGAWAALLERGGLPLVPEPGRGRVVPAAQLPLGIAGEREIIDVVLSTRLPLAEVRARVRASLPPPVELVDLHDVWVGAPSAAAAIVAADYRVEVAGVSPLSLGAATEAILAAAALPYERRREKKTQQFDLRPLILSLTIEAVLPAGAARADPPSAILRVRLRHDTHAVGRPEDVVAALAVPPAPPLDTDVRVLHITRERLLTNDA
ncbi:MAG: TIGR03936 family radical SAM-associated protein [Candidatus Limnocylindrales bacterium]